MIFIMVFNHSDRMAREIQKTPTKIWKEKDALPSNMVKPIKRLKSPKKSQECKKFTNDMKIEDVFLNSEYFKYQSGNVSSLSFCSGDNGENQWTINTKFELPIKPNSLTTSCHNEAIKSDTAVLAEKNYKPLSEKLKSHSSYLKENSQEKTEKFIEGILSDKGRFDRDLITLITEQMFLAERELQITRTHLIETISKLNERDLEIIQLHEKIQNLQNTKKLNSSKSSNSVREKSESSTKSSEDYQRLIMASEKLKKQVKDMEEFLNDYGLVWVGEKETQKPDFDKIIKNFHRLNAIASHPKIIQTTLGAKFELPREIPVVLYQNGLLLRNRDFRDYNKTSTALFLQDVEDGYFPSELQTEFPEGVPFEVIDKRHEVFNPDDKIQVFKGNGNRLGSSFEGKPSKVVFLEPVKHSKQQESHSSHEFLEKFKKLQKKRSFMQQDEMLFKTPRGSTQKICDNYPDMNDTTDSLITVKIRYGKEKTDSFFLEIPENKRMIEFERVLQRKLCEMYHDECIESPQTNNNSVDFEIHVYGHNPFRLSDQLNQYPKDCGIVNNCVINISEI